MTTVDDAVQNLAYVAAAKKLLADFEDRNKQVLIAANKRRTEHAADGDTELAQVVVKDTGQVSVSIDEAETLPWAVAEFGDTAIETVTRLTLQGRASVLKAAKDGTPIPGVTVTPAQRRLTVAVTPAKNIVTLVQDMASRGVLDLRDVLQIGAGE